MEESSGAQYALQVALQTLRDRCQQFQQRIADLEDENLNLRSKSKDSESAEASLPEIDSLQLQIAQLTEQKLQLGKKVEMITAENNNLWAWLSKLTQVKENLDSKLIKISDTISSHSTHTNLVRSKTFTQNEPHVIASQGNIQDENEKISLDLEDISLKLLNSIAKEKQELEMQCSQMAEIQVNETLFSNSYAFVASGEEVIEYDQLEKQLTDLKTIKFALLKQRENLEVVENFISTKPRTCAKCRVQKNTTSASVQTLRSNQRSSLTEEESAELQSLMNWGTPGNSFHNNDNINNNSEVHTTLTKEVLNNDSIKICPICSRMFYSNTAFSVFQQHVEQHFILDSDAEYEIVP